MGKMENNEIYLTFKTDKDTSEFLKQFAHLYGKTQSELINEICIDFKNEVIRYIHNEQNLPSDPGT